MTQRDFVFWMQGFFEITGNVETLNSDQTKMIKEHLQLVFKHDPVFQPKTLVVPVTVELGVKSLPPIGGGVATLAHAYQGGEATTIYC